MDPGHVVTTVGAPSYVDFGAPGGTLGVFGVVVNEVSAPGTSPSLSIAVQTKNFADTSWTDAATFTAITTATHGLKEASGLKQQVRLKCTQSGTDAWSDLDVFTPRYLP